MALRENSKYAEFVVSDADIVSTAVPAECGDPTKVDVVIYHSPCPDGFAAAYAAWATVGDAANFIGCSHGSDYDHMHAVVAGKNVAVLDFSFRSDLSNAFIKSASSFVVLDHHASAEQELRHLPPCNKVFEMKQSGCTLAWNYFHPGVDVPLLLRYVEDKDIWRWSLRSSKEVNAALSAQSFTFQEFHQLVQGGADAISRLVDAGAAMLSQQTSIVQSHLKKAFKCTLSFAPSFPACVVNSTVFASELGNALCVQCGASIGVVWHYEQEADVTRVSLRSNSDDVDVSVMAKSMGGGGHRRASGFELRGCGLNSLVQQKGW
jgi:oligoribonuclease NrnB/cAMP/cGMP phosphodiesterase (DHH superfamily)